MTRRTAKTVLLLSGGIDSTALAAIERPDLCLFVDYGQRPAKAERRAAEVVASRLGLPFRAVALDLRAFGSGLLHGDTAIAESPSPEWWPFRNQFLATAGAAVAIQAGLQRVVVGSVLGDGDRHVDGSHAFYGALDALVSMQEGDVHVEAPAVMKTTETLVAESGVGANLLGWTVSCHRSDLACHECPGCWKRERVFDALGLFEHG